MIYTAMRVSGVVFVNRSREHVPRQNCGWLLGKTVPKLREEITHERQRDVRMLRRQ